MKTTDELVAAFAEGVMAQKEALRQGDSTAGNRAANKYWRAWQRLRSIGDVGREALAELMLDARSDVRGMAAACLLRFRHDEATRVLEEVSKGEGIAAFGASEALERWREGDWHLDPE